MYIVYTLQLYMEARFVNFRFLIDLETTKNVNNLDRQQTI
jgi:hypothetical protein